MEEPQHTPMPDILALIERLSFRVAKTMPHIPHEYTVRPKEADRPSQPQMEADYVALYTAVQTRGVLERYKGRKKRYLYPGDGRKYWVMTSHMPSSYILNRMRLEDDEERMRRENPDSPHLPGAVAQLLP